MDEEDISNTPLMRWERTISDKDTRGRICMNESEGFLHADVGYSNLSTLSVKVCSLHIFSHDSTCVDVQSVSRTCGVKLHSCGSYLRMHVLKQEVVPGGEAQHCVVTMCHTHVLVHALWF